MSSVAAETASPPGRAGEPPLFPVVLHGVGAGVVASLVATSWLCFCAEVSNAPTAVPGVDSSTWTPLTSIATLIAGRGALHGSFHVLPILFGLDTLLVLGGALGALGAAIVHGTVGPGANTLAATVVGGTYGLCLEIGLVNLAVNAIQQPNYIYESLPSWAWWSASAIYGMTLALLVTRRWRRTPLHVG